MSRRDNQDIRCATCQMHSTLCVCELIPRIQTRARLSLLIHYREARKPTNTGQLAARCLVRSSIGIVGDRSPLPLPLVGDNEQGILLFPAEDAVPIASFSNSSKPLVLIVPDGNWRQASKMRNRIAGLATVPCVLLPHGLVTNYRLRSEPRGDGLATMEAIAYAMGVLEGERGAEIQAALLHVLRTMVERTLWLRGTLRSEDVCGGIPQDAIGRDGRGGG